MIRSLKTLGLLTVAALAMSAMVASAAQANGIFASGKTPSASGPTKAHFHSVQTGGYTENYFEAPQASAQKISCENANVSLTGTLTGEDKEVTVKPVEYSECGTVSKEGETHKINRLVTVTMNGCHYRFNQPTELEANTWTGTVDLVCPKEEGPILHISANKIHTINVCTIEIEPQTGIGHVVYHNQTNTGKPDDITATVTAEKIKYVNRKGCPKENQTFEDGKYLGNYTITSVKTKEGTEEATTEPADDDIWISSEE